MMEKVDKSSLMPADHYLKLNNVIPRQNVKLLQWCGLVNIFTYTYLDVLSAYTRITNLWSAFLVIPTRDRLPESNDGLFDFNLILLSFPIVLVWTIRLIISHVILNRSFSLHPANRKSRKNMSTSFLTKVTMSFLAL